MSEQPEIWKGLNGVVADYTEVSKVNPETNSLLYRGYPVQVRSSRRFQATPDFTYRVPILHGWTGNTS